MATHVCDSGGTLLCQNQVAAGPSDSLPHSTSNAQPDCPAAKETALTIQQAQEPSPSSRPSRLWQQPSKHGTSHSSLHKSMPRHPAETPREQGKRDQPLWVEGGTLLGAFFFFFLRRCGVILFYFLTLQPAGRRTRLPGKLLGRCTELLPAAGRGNACQRGAVPAGRLPAATGPAVPPASHRAAPAAPGSGAEPRS